MRRRAFTLIEMLVVIAIVALLAAVPVYFGLTSFQLMVTNRVTPGAHNKSVFSCPTAEYLGGTYFLPYGMNMNLSPWNLPLAVKFTEVHKPACVVAMADAPGPYASTYPFNSHSYGRGNEPRIQITANLVRPQILSGYFTNAIFHINGRGVANLPYQIQATGVLTATNWQFLGTVTADGVGGIQFDDPSASNQLRRFYRLSH